MKKDGFLKKKQCFIPKCFKTRSYPCAIATFPKAIYASCKVRSESKYSSFFWLLGMMKLESGKLFPDKLHTPHVPRAFAKRLLLPMQCDAFPSFPITKAGSWQCPNMRSWSRKVTVLVCPHISILFTCETTYEACLGIRAPFCPSHWITTINLASIMCWWVIRQATACLFEQISCQTYPRGSDCMLAQPRTVQAMHLLEL